MTITLTRSLTASVMIACARWRRKTACLTARILTKSKRTVYPTALAYDVINSYGGDTIIQRHNGSSYVNWYDVTACPPYRNNQWNQFSETITDAQYLITDFRLRFDSTALVDNNESITIDDVVITIQRER